MSKYMDNSTQLQRIDQIYFKREDQNITGSIKFRGLLRQINEASVLGHTTFTVSSSGNAAIAAAHICHDNDYKLTVFVSKNIDKNKLKQLQTYHCTVVVHISPLEASLEFADQNGAYHLRQATDPFATLGYRDIAHELVEQVISSIPLDEQNTVAVFFPVSSGTTVVGMYEGFVSEMEDENIQSIPQLHIVQSAAIHPIAQQFDSDFRRKAKSIVDSIVPPLNPPRKASVQNIINKTNGTGWICNDDTVRERHKWLRENDIETSYEGALALAAFLKSKSKARVIKYPIILCTGSMRV